ncbi:MAG: dTDP-4-dehydrorhamnose 3,5-epimerase [Planctomycetaceae bacterium]|nr:dTDP-4-dehydrorhamnose 3,5-epimerase [Planctomycetaceae bacterium]
MQFAPTRIKDVILVTPKLFGDARGFFLEMYHQEKFQAGGIDAQFVQDNLSRSQRGVLRGLHYQIQHPQGKLVTVLSGKIFDVAVDVRRRSPTFGQWVGAILDDESRQALYIPPGFAHGFSVLSDSADVYYKCTDLYHPEHERTLLWNDPTVNVDWQLEGDPILSPKDVAGMPLGEVERFA